MKAILICRTKLTSLIYTDCYPDIPNACAIVEFIWISCTCFRVGTEYSLYGQPRHAGVWLWSGHRDRRGLLRQENSTLLHYCQPFSLKNIWPGQVQLGGRGGCGIRYVLSSHFSNPQIRIKLLFDRNNSKKDLFR